MGLPFDGIAFASVLATGLLALAAPAQSKYRVTDLDGNGVLSLGAAFRIAESGTAVGLGNPLTSSDTRGVLWDRPSQRAPAAAAEPRDQRGIRRQ